MSNRRFTIGVLGARGHVGAELLPLLFAHPGLEVAAVASRAFAGRRVAEDFAGAAATLRYEALSADEVAARGLDAWILALPNGEAAPYVDRIAERCPDTVLIDLSADHRFDTTWGYGLVEQNRAELSLSRRIANPGCYATGMQLALAPLVEITDGPAVVFGVSGYSGAGTTPSPRNDPAALTDNLMPYHLIGHLHEREASRHLGQAVHFMPHVAAFFRGISLTLTVPLTRPATAAELFERTAAEWAGEPLIRVTREAPLVRDNVGQHHVAIGGFTVDEAGTRAVLVATLDNLLKGAATQALQNLNLALGLDELLGIAT